MAALLALALPGPAAPQAGFARLAPYAEIAWPEDGSPAPRIVLDGERLELTSIDGAAVAEIVGFARSTWGGLWQKRFEEDLVEVLTRMGRPPGPAVELGLRDPASGRTFTRAGVPMTEGNRQLIVRANLLRAGVTLGVSSPPPSRLTPEEVALDLAAFQAELEGRWAYLRTTGVDHRAAIERVRQATAGGTDLASYGMLLQKVIAQFVDGHAGVAGFSYPPSAVLPFLLETTGGRVLAIRPDRSGFVDPDRPYLTAIDGRPVEAWLRAAAAHVPAASPQWTLRNALRLLPRVEHLRLEMGLGASPSVEVELSPENPGGAGATLTLPLVPDRGGQRTPGWPPARPSGLLAEGRVGYLRLAAMDAGAAQQVAEWMPRFRNTDGLIVDVRGNTGGSRDALLALFPHLMTGEDQPRVVNAARYRLHPAFAEDHLGGSRSMYREGWSGWTPEERQAIARFREGFRPEWSPPEDEFSEWHYLVLSRRSNPDAYFYDAPVVVLLDESSFSATDIFVSALQGWRNVTLLGTPSGGGSARQVATRLPVSGLTVNLASMASFRWDGRLHDGNGTAPDVLVHPAPGSFLVGGQDNVLEAALARLRR